MANCCNDIISKCDELVTIGYMIDMIGMASSAVCVDVSTPSSTSTCDCSADGSAYTPTLSEINNGTYAGFRTIYEDPANDINGFSASSNASSYNTCCSASSGNSNIKKSDLILGYTTLSAIRVSQETPNECDDSWVEGEDYYTNTYKADLYRTYARYNIDCINGETGPQTDTKKDEAFITKEIRKIYSSITSGDCSATCVVTYDPSSFTSSVTVSNWCSSSKSAEISGFSYQSYTVSVEVKTLDEIECDGGEAVSAYTKSNCKDVSITNSYLYHGDNEQDIESGLTSASTEEGVIVYTIPKNVNNYTDSKIALVVRIGNKSGTIICELNRKPCKIIPVVDDDAECGIFPSIVDDWSNLNSIIYKGYTC